jgi:nucleotide-binding universal stress UspA family protein
VQLQPVPSCPPCQFRPRQAAPFTDHPHGVFVIDDAREDLDGHPLTLLTVTEPFPTYSGITPGSIAIVSDLMQAFDAQQAKQAAEVLAKAAAQADAMGVAATTLHVPRAQAADAIVAAARDQAAQLIVMASHGRRGLGRLLLGSQATEVLSLSKIPVLVVK